MATAEFLLDRDGRFWFLEVNARLQVEHGVTELVTGLDLVHEQLWLASGAPLSDRVRAAASRATAPDSHAIEVRISLEDPARSFAPSGGRVGRFALPGGPGVRVDTALEPGEQVPSDYDPLVAKLIVQGRDRPAAIARLRRALGETEITGVQTTLPFHRFVADSRRFREGDLSTGFVEEAWDGPADRTRAVDRALLGAGLAAVRPVGSTGPTVPSAVLGDAGAVREPGATGWRTAARTEGTDPWTR